jgi:hypothetical protein
MSAKNALGAHSTIKKKKRKKSILLKKKNTPGAWIYWYMSSIPASQGR